MEKLKFLFPKFLLFFVGTILVLALYNIIKIFWPEPTPEVVKDPNFGLELTEDPEDINFDSTQGNIGDLTGYLYFDSIPVLEADDIESNPGITAYSHSFEADTHTPVFDYYGNYYDLTPLSSTTVVFLSALQDETENTVITPIQLDTNTGKYEVLAAGDGYTPFSITTNASNTERVVTTFLEQNAKDSTKIEPYWFVFYNPYLESDIIFSDSASPVWINDGEDLIFLKKDGIYQYNLATQELKLVFDTYSNFDIASQLAAAPNSNYLVLTIPSINSISILSFDTEAGLLYEKGVIRNEEVVYSDPVVSPDNRFYAVLAKSEDSTRIEFRNVFDRTVMHALTFDDVDQKYLNLSAWTEYRVMSVSEEVLAGDNEEN